MYYKIGTLAKRFGITTQALRFYEAQGFLAPDREHLSTTRRYHARNLKWLTSIRRYHDLGFGVEEIQQLFFCDEPEQLKRRMEKKEIEVLAEVAALEKRLEALRQQRADLERIGSLLHRCEITASPRLWILIDQIGQNLDESKEISDLIQAWMKELPFVYSASVVPRKAVVRDSKHMDRKSGFCVEEDMAIRLSLAEGEKVEKIDYKHSIHTITRLSEEEPLMEHVLNYAEENGLEITGDAVGRCLVKTGEHGCQDKQIKPKAVYYEYWIPIKSREDAEPSRTHVSY